MPASSRLPPESSRSPCSVPTAGIKAVHFRGHVIVLRDLLLNAELLVALVLRVVADVSNACLLVFINVEGSSFHRRVLNFVRWQGGVHLLLLWRLRREGAEASRRQQRCCIGRSHLGAAGHKKRGRSDSEG